MQLMGTIGLTGFLEIKQFCAVDGSGMVLCSIARSLGMKIKLQQNAIPTIDAGNVIKRPKTVPAREQRKVGQNLRLKISRGELLLVNYQTCRNF